MTNWRSAQPQSRETEAVALWGTATKPRYEKRKS